MARIVFILILFFSAPVVAQTIIKGVVTSVEKEPVSGASVVLKDDQSNIVSYSFSEDSGKYTITAEKSGAYTIEVNYLGFRPFVATLKINNPGVTTEQNFTLVADSELLKDLIIEIEAPVKQRGDTLVYDARAFSTGREQVVEDLLKNIPGITVEKNGKIKFEDIEIEKIMIGGDDFFNKGYTLLSKNMPSKPLDKIEVLQKYSNNKLLKGIENSNKVALNLTLQEAYKNVWFGDISAGYGLATENRYEAKGNLMNFGTKAKHFLTFGLNNLGNDDVGSLTDMFYNASDMESVGTFNAGPSAIMGLSAGGTLLKEHRTRFNNAEMVSLNTIMPLSSKIKAKFSGFMGFDELNSYRNSVDFTKTNTVSFTNYENEQYRNKLKTGYVNAFLTYDISKTQLLQSSTLYNTGETNNTNHLVFNKTSTLEKLQTRNTFFDQKLTYTHKWQERNVIVVKARFFDNRLPQFYGINDYLMGDLFSYNASFLNNDITNNKQYTGLETDIKLKQKKGNLIEFRVGFENTDQQIGTRFMLYGNDGESRTPENFQSNSRFFLRDLYAKSGYTFDFKYARLKVNADVHQLFNDFKNISGIKTSQSTLFVNPNLNFGWDITGTHRFTADYSYNHTNTDVLEVNDSFLLQSSRGFAKGLGSFNLLESQSAAVNYSIRHYLNRFRFSVGLHYNKANNIISSRSLVAQNSTLSESILLKGGDNYRVNFTSNFYLKKLKSNIRFEINASQNISFNEINNSGTRKNTYQSTAFNFEWKTSFKSPFNFYLSTEWSDNRIKSDFTNTYVNGVSTIDLYYRIGQRFDLKVSAENYYFGSLQQDKKGYNFLDLSGIYKFKDDKYSISITANNLFNTEYFNTYYANDMGYSYTSYRLLPRYVVGTFKLRF